MAAHSCCLPEADRFSRLLTERKHFIDTIKLIAYCAETSMASVLRKRLSRADDARALLRQIYDTDVDLIPDLQAKTLTVRLHHLTHAAHHQAVLHLCDRLNATETIFPDTEFKPMAFDGPASPKLSNLLTEVGVVWRPSALLRV